MTRALGPASPAISQFLKDLMPGRPALTFLSRAAAEIWGVSEVELTGPARVRFLLEPRQVICFLALRKAAHGSSKVGRHICRHWATSYHATIRIEARIEVETELRERVAKCWSLACLLANRHVDIPVREMTHKECRAYNEGIEAAARMAELWADECLRMADHTIKADPLLEMMRGKTVIDVDKACAISTALTEEGNEHAIRHHAARDIAAMIRWQRLERTR